MKTVNTIAMTRLKGVIVYYRRAAAAGDVGVGDGGHAIDCGGSRCLCSVPLLVFH